MKDLLKKKDTPESNPEEETPTDNDFENAEEPVVPEPLVEETEEPIVDDIDEPDEDVAESDDEA